MKKISLLLVLFICLFTVIGCKNDNKSKIYSITPTSGLVEGGNKVSIYGEKLPDGLNIYFGDNKATVESQSDSAVVVTVPKGKVGEVIITIKDSDNNEISKNHKYTYYQEEIKDPIISGLSIYSSLISGGERITIYGQNFASDVKVFFGDKEAKIETIDSILITCVIPNGSVGKVDVTVKNVSSNKKYTLKDSFEYYDEAVKNPKIIGLSINQGYLSGGENVTIYGENFSDTIEVYFGKNKATIKAKSENLIIVAVPSAASASTVAVKVTDTSTNLSHSLSGAYTYIEEVLPELKVTGISSSEGNVTGGEQVTIYGKNFSSNVEVYFGTSKATITSNDDSVIIVKTPAGTKGTVDIKVKDLLNNEEFVLEDAYTYKEALTKFTITGITSNKGSIDGGEVISIFGTNFTSDIVVLFGESPAIIKSYSSTALIVETPSQPEGIYDIIVKDSVTNQTVTLAQSYEYYKEQLKLEISLNPGVDTVEIFSNFIDAGAVATFGKKTIPVTVESYVDITKVGQYFIYYSATYEGITVQIRRSVMVIDETSPILKLNSGIDTIILGKEWIDAGITIFDNSNEVLFADVYSTVNINAIGEYTVTYTVTDSSGNTSTIVRYVNVISEE